MSREQAGPRAESRTESRAEAKTESRAESRAEAKARFGTAPRFDPRAMPDADLGATGRNVNADTDPDTDPDTDADTLEHMGRCLVQHGPLNARAYLMHLEADEAEVIVSRLDELARARGYTKIFAKVPQSASAHFTRAGYDTEAVVPGLYHGDEDGLFMGRYFADWRRRPARPDTLRAVLDASRAKAAPPADRGANDEADAGRNLPQGAKIQLMTPDRAEAMAALYASVFDSYPFPVFDPAFLRQNMAGDVRYYGVSQRDRVVALASAEMDPAKKSAEMTDFATLPDFRGHKLARQLLAFMTSAMRRAGMRTLYTIARAESYAMNITFARAGYAHAGILPNNTNIGGGLESMNVWYLSLRPGANPTLHPESGTGT